MHLFLESKPFKLLLRSAVIAAIPVATQVGCTTNEPQVTEPPKAKDPCRGPITKHPIQGAGIRQVLPDSAKPSAAECVSLCRNYLKEQVLKMPATVIVGIENTEVKGCEVKPLPLAMSQPFSGIRPPSNIKKNTLVCQVDYVALQSSYTGAPGCIIPPRPVVGRLTQGTHVKAQINHNLLGDYFSDMAAMETAAITAFQYLARELEAYEAPESLIQAAYQAANEEVQHAEMAGLLSKAYDTKIPEVIVDDFRLRSLYEIALENAVEGCVSETFAAACGLWQSEHAELEPFKQVIAHITDEEMGHAALSWSIHQWAMPQLTEVQQDNIRQAQQQAISRLAQSFKHENNPMLQRAVGLPNSTEAARLFDQLNTTVWAA